MYYKFHCNSDLMLVCGNCKIQDRSCPGVKSIDFSLLEMFWTGYFHIFAPKNSILSFQTTEIDSIYSRSSLDEDDEEWKLLFNRENKVFSYEYENDLALLISKLSDNTKQT